MGTFVASEMLTSAPDDELQNCVVPLSPSESPYWANRPRTTYLVEPFKCVAATIHQHAEYRYDEGLAMIAAIAATERSTSASVVDQFDTAMRM